MIQMTSTLDVADNSGAKKLMCIRVLGGTKRKYASIGDVIVVSIKEAIPTAKVKKGDVAKAVIVRTKKEVARATQLLERCGARAQTEQRMAELFIEADAACGDPVIQPKGRELLRGAIDYLIRRER